MELRVETIGECSVLKPAGRLDGPGAQKFRQATAALHSVETEAVVIDLGDTTALASAGLDAILRLADDHRRHGKRLVLIQCSATATRLLRASGADAVIPIYQSFADARAALQSTKKGP
jgi:anti-anti-sigma factor